MDDGGGQLHFLGFILANKSLNEIAAGLDPNELLPMTEWETDESIGRIGVDGIPLDGKLNFYTDADLGQALITGRSMPRAFLRQPEKADPPPPLPPHWWSQATLLDGGWRSLPLVRRTRAGGSTTLGWVGPMPIRMGMMGSGFGLRARDGYGPARGFSPISGVTTAKAGRFWSDPRMPSPSFTNGGRRLEHSSDGRIESGSLPRNSYQIRFQ